MQVSYSRLWKLLIDKKMNKTALKDETVSMEVIGRICDALNCRVEDVVEIIPKDKE